MGGRRQNGVAVSVLWIFGSPPFANQGIVIGNVAGWILEAAIILVGGSVNALSAVTLRQEDHLPMRCPMATLRE